MNNNGYYSATTGLVPSRTTEFPPVLPLVGTPNTRGGGGGSGLIVVRYLV
jgi:hypothetical protein